jgi:GT2 family glycosyltransferase
MNFSVVICTYKRAQPLLKLLESVGRQSLYPFEILIIDASPDNFTEKVLGKGNFRNLSYHKVTAENRGLTRQRNYGIDKVAEDTEIVCFLDDDTILEKDYFEMLLQAYEKNPDAIGIGGVAINQNRWKDIVTGKKYDNRYYILGNHVIKESSRNYFRKIIGLQSPEKPGVMPEFSHGRTYSYPLTGDDYPVDLLVGMSMSFKKTLFKNIKFSEYFYGYGLYEDADFSIRALNFGQNYIATNVRLSHFHNASGRPNKFDYGKMVVRNGWYVWRIKFPNPSLVARIKWHAITLLLITIRFLNSITEREKKEAFTESLGRTMGWFSLFVNKPSQE